MNSFINQYRVDETYLKEYSTAWLRRSFFNPYSMVISVMLILTGAALAILSVIFHLESAYVLLGVTDVFLVALLLIKYNMSRNKMIEVNKARIDIVFKDVYDIQNEFNEEECIANSNYETKTYTIPMSLVKDHYESKNYYFVIFNGEIFVTLCKTGFKAGTFEGFREYIEKYPKQKRFRAFTIGFCLTMLLLMTVRHLYQIGQMCSVLGI